MTLSQWLKKNGVSQSYLAENMGVSVPTISSICCGRKNPSLELAVKLSDFTGGEVEVRNLLSVYRMTDSEDQAA